MVLNMPLIIYYAKNAIAEYHVCYIFCNHTKTAITSSKLTTETLEEHMKYV